MAWAPEPRMSGWLSFVERHQDPRNHVVHALSALVFVVGLTQVLTAAWHGTFSLGWFLVFWSAGPIGAFGHWWTGDGVVSTRESTADPRVPFYVLRMFFELSRGTYGDQVARVREQVG